MADPNVYADSTAALVGRIEELQRQVRELQTPRARGGATMIRVVDSSSRRRDIGVDLDDIASLRVNLDGTMDGNKVFEQLPENMISRDENGKIVGVSATAVSFFALLLAQRG